jgi:hypothetical protein
VAGGIDQTRDSVYFPPLSVSESIQFDSPNDAQHAHGDVLRMHATQLHPSHQIHAYTNLQS